jgi:hypothetical protein
MRDASISDVGFQTNRRLSASLVLRDGRWPAAAVDGRDLRLEAVDMLTGGTKDDC